MKRKWDVKRICILMIAVLTFGLMFTTDAFATDLTEPAVRVRVSVTTSDFDLGRESLKVYLKNVDTGAITDVELHSPQDYKATKMMSRGTYEVEKCVLLDEETVEYRIASGNDTIFEIFDDPSYISFEIEDTPLAGSEEGLKRLEQKEKMNALFSIAILVIFVLVLACIVLFIWSRFNDDLEEWWWLIFRLTLSLICGVLFVGFSGATTLSGMILPFYIGAGFPYGCYAMSRWIPLSFLGLVLIIVTAAFVGMVALPFVLIHDIIVAFTE